MSPKRRKGKGPAPGATRASKALVTLGIEHELRPYELPPDADESTLGEAAAGALGIAPETAFKTLIALCDGEPACAVVPVSGTLSLKALAAAAGAKRAIMAPLDQAERITGYVKGGISPLGQLKRLRTFVDASVTAHERVHVSAGQRGLDLCLASADLLTATEATAVDGLGAG